MELEYPVSWKGWADWNHEAWKKRQVAATTKAEGKAREQVVPKTSVRGAYPVFEAMLIAAGIPAPVAEFRFHPTRKWRLDYCWPAEKLGLECNGGVWIQGRHNRGQGFIDDCEKLNAAAILGWRILQYTPQQLSQAVTDVKRILGVGQ